MARSGIAIAKLLSHYENNITISDIAEQKEETVKELEDMGIKVIITKEQADLIENTYNVIIKNPAIKSDHPALEKAKSFHIPIINELEASFSFLPKDIQIIGITGSNGKTTTTTVVYELLKYTNKNIHVGGNIGTPLASLVEQIKSGDILVLEISDHQLCDMYTFKTDISIMTNLSEVHLDFHGSYEKYKEMKKRIFNHHTNKNIAILNKENHDVLELTKDISSQKFYFSSQEKADIYIKNDKIIYKDEEIINCHDMKLKGVHNYENSMIGILIAKMFHVKNADIKHFFNEFGGVEHRLEYVCEKNGRKFYNDSKSTNNQSTIIALNSFTEPTILLMGGLDRNIPFEEIAPSLTHIKMILCYGETKEKIKEFAIQNNKPVMVLENLKEATFKAYEISEKGDIILLSPACASWDQYSDFEKRGKEFKEWVKKIK